MREMLNLDASLEPIQGELASYLSRVADRFDAALESDILAVQRLTEHVERYRGKMLRPALVALAAGAASGDLTEVLQSPKGAAVEVIHVHRAHLRKRAIVAKLHSVDL
ncbi:MAG: hypothetical protein HRU13_14040, partial [Phycisphaerales bacterium]|nr:hypothetical protein [Phycisphaerales bacterium]